MSAQAALILNDAAAVNHTYSPLGVQNGVARWIDRTTQGVVQGMPRISIAFREPKGNDIAHRAYKHEVVYRFPVLEGLASGSPTGYNPPAKEAYALVFRGQWLIPERATLTERQNAFKLGNAQLLQLTGGWPYYEQVVNLDVPY